MLVEGKDPVLRSNGFLYRDYIYVSDVIDALLLVGEGGKGIYNLGSEQAYTVKEIVKMLEAIHGTSTLPVYADNSHLELRYQHMNYDKINRELGWMPNIGINAGLKRTYDWYKERQSD
jgi:nucleoside-diphosphate-sugar epimerase